MANPETPKADENPAKNDVEDAVIVDDLREITSAEVVTELATGEASVNTESAPAEPSGASTAPEAPPPPPAETRADSSHAPEPAPARSGGFLALLLGGVLAAGAGFGLSRVVPEGWPMIGTAGGNEAAATLAAQSSEIEALKAQIAAIPAPVDTGALDSRMDALETALAAAEAAAQDAVAAATEAAALAEAAASRPVGGADAEAAAKAAADAAARAEAAASALAAIPAAEASGPELSPQLDALTARIAALEAAPSGSDVQSGDPAAAAALAAEVAGLREELAAQQAASAEAVEAVKAAAAAATADVATAEAEAEAALAAAQAEAEAMRDAAETAARATLMRAALARVEAGVESGAPFAAAVDELAAGGITVPEALVAKGAGVPSLATLQDSFPEAAREALAVSLKATAGDGVADRLGAFLRTQTGARSLEPREGEDPDAVLSRAEALLKDGQVGPAVAEIAALPEAGQAAMAGWVASAQIRVDAQAALAELAATVGGQ